jgi:hypothetical protein
MRTRPASELQTPASARIAALSTSLRRMQARAPSSFFGQKKV